MGSGTTHGGGAIVIRRALLRRTLAIESERASLAALLELCVSDVVAIEHLVEQGRLSPTQLRDRLRLSSGGSTALVQRLERAGHVVREPHPADRRGVLVRLSPGIESRLAAIKAPLVERIEELTAQLNEGERRTVEHFLECVTEASERHAEDVAREAGANAAREPEIVLPCLWA